MTYQIMMHHTHTDLSIEQMMDYHERIDLIARDMKETVPEIENITRVGCALLVDSSLSRTEFMGKTRQSIGDYWYDDDSVGDDRRFGIRWAELTRR